MIPAGETFDGTFPFNLILPKLPPYHSYYVFNLSLHTYKMQKVGKLIQEFYRCDNSIYI